MNDVINKIYEEVRNRWMNDNNYSVEDFYYHVDLVYKIATKICGEYGADYNVVALAALLNDIALLEIDLTEYSHNLFGHEVTVPLLYYEHKLPMSFVSKVDECIVAHHGRRGTPNFYSQEISPEEICVIDAVAMSRFYSVPYLLRRAYVENGMSVDEGANYVSEKLERSYNRLSLKGKELIKPYCESSRVLIKSR